MVNQGFLTLRQILGTREAPGPLPVSPATWWRGVRSGRFPKPVKIGGRTIWAIADIDELLGRIAQGDLADFSGDRAA